MNKFYMLFICFFINSDQKIFTAQDNLSCSKKDLSYYNFLLKIAASQGVIEHVNTALNCNANEIMTALEAAAKNNNPNHIIEHILNKKNLSYNSFTTLSPQFYEKHQEQFLFKTSPKKNSLEYNRIIHIKPQEKHPLAMIAMFEHKNNFLSYVLQHLNKKDINVKNLNGTTLLTLAAEQKNLEAVEELLKYDIELEAKDSDQETALANAIRVGAYDIAELLLAKGANPNNITLKLFNKLPSNSQLLISKAKKLWNERSNIEKDHLAKLQKTQEEYFVTIAKDHELYLKEKKSIEEQKKQQVIREKATANLIMLPNEETLNRTSIEKQLDFEYQRALQKVKKNIQKAYQDKPIKKIPSTDSIPLISSPSPISPISSRQSPEQLNKEKIQELLKSKQPSTAIYNQIRDIVQKEKTALLIPTLIKDFLGKFNNVTINLDHIINVTVKLAKVSLNSSEFIIIFSGGHTKEAVQKLQNLGLIKINHTKTLPNGCQIFDLQNLVNNTFFKKSTFPEDWTQEKLFENIFFTKTIIKQEQDPNNKSILIITAKTLDQSICYKILFNTSENTVFTAYPLESC